MPVKKQPFAGDESGVVLIVVVFVVALLAILVLQFGYLISLDSRMASTYRSNLEAYYLAKAGLHQAIALLEDDKLTDPGRGEGEAEGEVRREREQGSKEKEEGSDDLEEDWAQPQEPVQLGSGQFVFKIVDEDRKFNLNLLVKGAIEEVESARDKVLGQDQEEEEEAKPEEGEKKGENQAKKVEEVQGEEEEEQEEAEEETEIDEEIEKMLNAYLEKLEVELPKEKVKNIIDWLDSDDDGEAEGDYYRGLEPGYPCKNKPMETIGELALIKEIDPALFRGDPYREKIEIMTEELEEGYYPPEEEGFLGLRHYLTVYSDGKVNVNTASRTTLEVMLGEDHEDLAEAIIRARQELPFKQVDEIEKALEEDIPVQVLERFKVRSSYFNILSEGQVGEVTARVRAVVRRGEDRVDIVYWKFES